MILAQDFVSYATDSNSPFKNDPRFAGYMVTDQEKFARLHEQLKNSPAIVHFLMNKAQFGVASAEVDEPASWENLSTTDMAFLMVVSADYSFDPATTLFA